MSCNLDNLVFHAAILRDAMLCCHHLRKLGLRDWRQMEDGDGTLVCDQAPLAPPFSSMRCLSLVALHPAIVGWMLSGAPALEELLVMDDQPARCLVKQGCPPLHTLPAATAPAPPQSLEAIPLATW